MQPISRRQFSQMLGGALGMASFVGCDAVWRLGEPRSAQFRLSDSDLADNDPVWRVLNRLAYGPRPGDIDRVREMGAEAFVEEQLAPETVTEAAALEDRLSGLETLNLDSDAARAGIGLGPGQSDLSCGAKAASASGAAGSRRAGRYGDRTSAGMRVAWRLQQSPVE